MESNSRAPMLEMNEKKKWSIRRSELSVCPTDRKVCPPLGYGMICRFFA